MVMSQYLSRADSGSIVHLCAHAGRGCTVGGVAREPELGGDRRPPLGRRGRQSRSTVRGRYGQGGGEATRACIRLNFFLIACALRLNSSFSAELKPPLPTSMPVWLADTRCLAVCDRKGGRARAQTAANSRELSSNMAIEVATPERALVTRVLTFLFFAPKLFSSFASTA